MNKKTIGFIGGGRITNIILKRFYNYGFDKILVSDIDKSILEKIKQNFPDVITSYNNKDLRNSDLLFIAIHPPVLNEVLSDINESLNENCIIVSLLPKITIQNIRNKLNGHKKIIRMIPNAPSIIGEGFNPISYSDSIEKNELDELLEAFKFLGKTPIVSEQKLEAYAIITAMGPTYFWFQLKQLEELGISFGLSKQESQLGIKEMIIGSVNTMYDSGLTYENVVDLIPVKPLKKEEENISKIYNDYLNTLYKKLKP
jgi:pyrroline-5-carboxylate reductase